jgi:hypothetical protein
VTAVSHDSQGRERDGELYPPDRDPGDLDAGDEAYVRSILAQHAEAGPVPAHIAERLDLALAAAAKAPDNTGATSGAEPAAAGSLARPLRRRMTMVPRRGHLTGPARRLLVAAVGVTVLAGGIGLAVVDRPTSDPGSSTADAAPEAATDDAGEVATGAGSGQEPAATPLRITTSGRDYRAGSLPAAAGLLLSIDATRPGAAPAARPDGVAEPDGAAEPDVAGQPERAARPGGPATVVPPAPALDRLRDAMTLGMCARALADGGSGQVLAADLARYQGQAAAVLVLPGPDPTVIDVWVVGPGCAPGDEQVLAHERVPR